MKRIDEKTEATIRKNIKVNQGIIDELNQMLIDSGCEPEKPGLVHTTKALSSGVVARTGHFLGKLKDGFKAAVDETKAAGETRLAEKEIDRQVAEQVSKLKKELMHSVPNGTKKAS